MSISPIPTIVSFPSHSSDTTASHSRKVINQGSKTVYPLKSLDDINALHHYFLDQAKTAKTPFRIMAAYRNWLFFSLGINMGFRGGDLTELTWSHLINFEPSDTSDPTDYTYTIRTDEYNKIHAEKTGKATYVFLNAEARQAIHYYLTATRSFGYIPYPESPVFFSKQSAGTSEATIPGHIDCDSMGHILKTAARACGIPQNICTHTLRKTFGYHYFKATNDITTLQKIFGHSSPGITLNYIGIDAETIRDAYETKPNTGIDLTNEAMNPTACHLTAKTFNRFKPITVSAPNTEAPVSVAL